MEWQTRQPVQTEAQQALIAEATRAFMARVYLWMFAGLAVTGAFALYSASNPTLALGVARAYVPFALGIFAFSWVVGLALPRLNAGSAAALFIVYAAALGVFLSSIFLVYKVGSIARVFFISGGMFGAMSLYGTITKRDLDAWRTFLFMGLFGIIAAVVVNLFWPTPMISFVAACAGVIVFAGLAAYDTQKLRQFGAAAEASGQKSLAISGALHLYLDFINLFLSLLRLFGSRR